MLDLYQYLLSKFFESDSWGQKTTKSIIFFQKSGVWYACDGDDEVTSGVFLEVTGYYRSVSGGMTNKILKLWWGEGRGGVDYILMKSIKIVPTNSLRLQW